MTAPLGAAAKWIWLGIARAGAVLAVIMSYRLARRFAGVGAGLFAAVGLVLSTSFVDYLVPFGMSEPLMAGLALLAIERHLDRHYSQTAWLLFACMLLRPELLPFFLLYGAFLWSRKRNSRAWLVAGLVTVPLVLFLPDYLGSGDWARSSQRATVASQGGALLKGLPGLAALQNGVRELIVPVIVGACVAAGWSVLAWTRRREERTVFGMVLISATCFVEEAVLTQLKRSSGEGRYMIIGYALACVLAGIGWDRVVKAIAAKWTSHRTTATRLVVAVIVAGTAPFVWDELVRNSRTVGELSYQAEKYGELATAIKSAGGRDRILGCGPVLADTYQIPAIAWDLDVHISAIVVVLPPIEKRKTFAAPDAAVEEPWTVSSGTVFLTRTGRNSSILPVVLDESAFHVVAQTAQWQILTSCTTASSPRPTR